MTPRERELLEAWAARSPVPSFDDAARWFILWSGGFCACVAGMMAACLTHPVVAVFIVSLLSLPAIACFSLTIQTVLSYRDHQAYHRDFLKNTRPQILLAIQQGQVTVKTISATTCIEIEPYEDEGAGWLFDVGGGNSFFVKGQGYETPENDTPWPSTEFEIVRTIPGDHILGVFSHGEALEPIRTIKTSDLPDDLAWANDIEQLIPERLEQAVQSIQRKP